MMLVYCFPHALDRASEVRAVEIVAKRFQLAPPPRRVFPNYRTARSALTEAGGFLEINLLSGARTRVPAGVAGQRPASWGVTRAVMVQVLLGHVRIVPLDVF